MSNLLWNRRTSQLTPEHFQEKLKDLKDSGQCQAFLRDVHRHGLQLVNVRSGSVVKDLLSTSSYGQHVQEKILIVYETGYNGYSKIENLWKRFEVRSDEEAL